MYEKLFQRIIQASEKNALTFFVGAGISKLSKAPKWSELIDAFCKELGIASKEDYSNDDYLAIPQKYYYYIKRDDKKYYDFISACFNNGRLEPNLIHRLMYSFQPKNFVTTNFDDLLEKSAIMSCRTYKSIACDKDIPSINGDRYILKLHGDLIHKNIVLKEEDYLNYSENFKLTETLLKSIFSTNTVVFIGYGLNDYNIKLILNWAKVLLDKSFNKPIFIYTDDKELDNLELIYQESKGLSVIDFRNCITVENDGTNYLSRYKAVFEKISSYTKTNTEKKDKFELFDVLYELLKPLNKFWTLKTTNVQNQLYPNIIVEENGALLVKPNGVNIIEYFCELNKLDNIIEKVSNDVYVKYKTILEVFSKARIRLYRQDNAVVKIKNTEYPFSDQACILFDYKRMYRCSNYNYKGMYHNYIKAYYCAKLKKYRMAYEILKEVTISAYKAKDYFLYYLAQINKISIYQAMKCANRSFPYFNIFSFDELEQKEVENSISQSVFENLPIEFKNQYKNFSDLYSANMLYKNSYYSFVEGQKLEDAIDSNTVEMGLTSSDTAICRINNNLHFLLGNKIFIDEFAEFKNTVKYTMSLLIYKYSCQEKKVLTPQLFPEFIKEKLIFDEIDFYCFVEYFNSKEIESLFLKYKVENIEFKNMDRIEISIKNLFNFYDKYLSDSHKAIELFPYQCKMKTCLSLLKYMTIPQKIIDDICSIIFKYEFREILINDKISFIYSQLYKKKMYSRKTQITIENTLISYINKQVECIKSGKNFELNSSSSNVHYWDLSHYLAANKESYKSLRLSKEVITIIDNNYKQLYISVLPYYPYISKKAQKLLINTILKSLSNNFKYSYFKFLIVNEIKVPKSIIPLLKKYLHSRCDNVTINANVRTFPAVNPYRELISVGYWCLLEILESNQFSEFVGVCDQFDFYYNYSKFNYDKFDTSWLFNLYPNTYITIAKEPSVRDAIRNCICKTIENNCLAKNEKDLLEEILVKYFC